MGATSIILPAQNVPLSIPSKSTAILTPDVKQSFCFLRRGTPPRHLTIIKPINVAHFVELEKERWWQQSSPRVQGLQLLR